MGWNRLALIAVVMAALACRRTEQSSAPQVTGDGGALPPGERANGPGVVQDDNGKGPKDILGDPLPKGATARLGSLRMLDRHLENMQFLPGGTQLVSASYDRYVVWDATSGRRIFELQRGDIGPAVAIAPSGVQLATSVVNSAEVQIWDLAARKPLEPQRAEKEVVSLCYLGEGVLIAGSNGLVASVGSDKDKKAPLRVTGAFNKLTSMACGGGGQLIALGDDSGAVYAVDLRKGLNAAVKLGA